MDIKRELDKTIKKYEQIFNRKIPGWFCSDEERLIDLIKAIETGIPYPEDDGNMVY